MLLEPESMSIDADQIWEATVGEIASRRRLPEATYRLQFHGGFTFADARRLVAYLHDLGITDCYASPLFRAREGSRHGYDLCDPNSLNPELGTPHDFEQLAGDLHAWGMGLVLDVVPNHMGIATPSNAWWMDVLENGQSSPFATFFDIQWNPVKPDLKDKVLLPFLGDQFGQVLENGDLRLRYADGAFFIQHFELPLPLAPCSSILVLAHRIDELKTRLGNQDPNLLELESIITGLRHLPLRSETAPEKVAERQREKEILKQRLAALAASSSDIAAFLAENVEQFNGRWGDPGSFDLLDRLLQEQSYRLAYWRVASDEINYRRFFDINELAAITVENLHVFEKTHQLVFRLIAEGKVNGLRIDHPDGLFDPPEYLRRLQERRFLQLARDQARRHFARGEAVVALVQDGIAVGQPAGGGASGDALRELRDPDDDPSAAPWEWLEPLLKARYRQEASRDMTADLSRPLYVVVEKILSRGESLPADWAVHGTTGYDFMDAVNGLLVDRTGEPEMTRIYHRYVNRRDDFADLAYESRQVIVDAAMSSELAMLAEQLDRLSERNRTTQDFTLNSLKSALREIVACFPVYRTYIQCDERAVHAPVEDRDRHFIETSVARAKRRNPAISATIFDFVRDVLLLKPLERDRDVASSEQRHFVGRFQQFTPPVMAKGGEDTAFYRYHRLVSLNEVGGRPEGFGMTLAAFHHQNLERANRWPWGLLATSTHDNKRSEDVRARIDVLSEIPDEWRTAVGDWTRLNRRQRTVVEGQPVPDRNTEYLLYQTLVGSWPLDGPLPGKHADFTRRIQEYMLKAVREAKVVTSWVSPHVEYESAVERFVAAILEDRPGNRFLNDFRGFVARVGRFGLYSSLSQTLLKLAAPGVPDMYQGNESWDFSLVDPDNRRPVDFERRRMMLADLKRRAAEGAGGLASLARELAAAPQDARAKLFVVWRALACRRAFPGLFTTGQYLPVDALGEHKEQVCAFLRSDARSTFLAIAPRLYTRLCTDAEAIPLGTSAWGDTALELTPPKPAQPDFAERALCWRNVLTGERVRPVVVGEAVRLPLAEALASFPVALLEAVGSE